MFPLLAKTFSSLECRADKSGRFAPVCAPRRVVSRWLLCTTASCMARAITQRERCLVLSFLKVSLRKVSQFAKDCNPAATHGHTLSCGRMTNAIPLRGKELTRRLAGCTHAFGLRQVGINLSISCSGGPFFAGSAPRAAPRGNLGTPRNLVLTDGKRAKSQTKGVGRRGKLGS